MNTDKLTAEALRENPEVVRALRDLMPRSPSYRFFRRPGSEDRYFWTTEKINHKDHPRYVAGIYRHLKTKKQWKLIKKVGFSRRYKAKQWAREAMRAEK